MTTPVVPRIVRCPRCGGSSVYAPDRPYRPFCSARCRDADLGAWSTGEYLVAEPPDDEAARPPEEGR